MSLRLGRRGAKPDTDNAGPVIRFIRMCFPTRASFALALLVCLVAPATLIVVHIHENPTLSPIDEAQHWDYVTRLAHGGFPRMGQRLQPATLRVVACRGTDLPAVTAPPCHQRVLKPGEFAGGDVPVRGAATAAVLRPHRSHALRHRGRAAHERLGGTRATGIVWLCAGLLMLWAAGRALGMEPARHRGGDARARLGAAGGVPVVDGDQRGLVDLRRVPRAAAGRAGLAASGEMGRPRPGPGRVRGRRHGRSPTPWPSSSPRCCSPCSSSAGGAGPPGARRERGAALSLGRGGPPVARWRSGDWHRRWPGSSSAGSWRSST